MKAVVQRVSQASVSVAGRTVGAIGAGLCVFAGIESGDGQKEVEWLARKLANLRIFNDAEGKMNRSLLETAGGLLLVSNFTVAGTVANGNRPDFGKSAKAYEAKATFEALAAAVRATGITVATGEFGADMRVHVDNDGPVTLILERSAC